MDKEKLFMDIVNAGIAIFKSGEGRMKNALVDLEKIYEDLKAKGQADQSENAQKLRDLLHKTVNDSKTVVNQANASYEEILQSVQENYSNLVNQVETMVPSEIKESIQKGLDELNKLLKKD